MPQAQSIGSRLHFDVLAMIFTICVEENEMEPETFLLVSRHWNAAATEHLHLWNNIIINAPSLKAAKALKVRIPLRIHRSKDTLLHIKFRTRNNVHLMMPKTEEEYDIYLDRLTIEMMSILILLIGKNGRWMARWKSFIVENKLNFSILKYLKFPTPHLQVLEVDCSYLDFCGIVPDLSSLQELSFFHYPMGVVHDTSGHERKSVIDTPNLKYLTMTVFSGSLSMLHHLDAPRLTHLAIVLMDLPSAQDFPVSLLNRLVVFAVFGSSFCHVYKMRSELESFFESLINLESLQICGSVIPYVRRTLTRRPELLPKLKYLCSRHMSRSELRLSRFPSREGSEPKSRAIHSLAD